MAGALLTLATSTIFFAVLPDAGDAEARNASHLAELPQSHAAQDPILRFEVARRRQCQDLVVLVRTRIVQQSDSDTFVKLLLVA